ncbi:MAG: hypothetical protein HY421_03190 [Candidatus Kerfeldbacteria bacterium]|nr:hypothetical protein [Candidatus Kerfeldbacteria bacterium]
MAVLGALSVYWFFSAHAPIRYSTQAAPSGTDVQAAVPETPTNARSLTGTIKAVAGDRLTVSTSAAVDGSLRERLVAVTLTPRTTYWRVEIAPVSLLSADQQSNPAVRTAANRRLLTPGRFLEIVSSEPISQYDAIVASQVDILEANRYNAPS